MNESHNGVNENSNGIFQKILPKFFLPSISTSPSGNTRHEQITSFPGSTRHTSFPVIKNPAQGNKSTTPSINNSKEKFLGRKGKRTRKASKRAKRANNLPPINVKVNSENQNFLVGRILSDANANYNLRIQGQEFPINRLIREDFTKYPNNNQHKLFVLNGKLYIVFGNSNSNKIYYQNPNGEWKTSNYATYIPLNSNNERVTYDPSRLTLVSDANDNNKVILCYGMVSESQCKRSDNCNVLGYRILDIRTGKCSNHETIINFNNEFDLDAYETPTKHNIVTTYANHLVYIIQDSQNTLRAYKIPTNDIKNNSNAHVYNYQKIYLQPNNKIALTKFQNGKLIIEYADAQEQTQTIFKNHHITSTTKSTTKSTKATKTKATKTKTTKNKSNHNTSTPSTTHTTTDIATTIERLTTINEKLQTTQQKIYTTEYTTTEYYSTLTTLLAKLEEVTIKLLEHNTTSSAKLTTEFNKFLSTIDDITQSPTESTTTENELRKVSRELTDLTTQYPNISSQAIKNKIKTINQIIETTTHQISSTSCKEDLEKIKDNLTSLASNPRDETTTKDILSSSMRQLSTITDKNLIHITNTIQESTTIPTNSEQLITQMRYISEELNNALKYTTKPPMPSTTPTYPASTFRKIGALTTAFALLSQGINDTLTFSNNTADYSAESPENSSNGIVGYVSAGCALATAIFGSIGYYYKCYYKKRAVNMQHERRNSDASSNDSLYSPDYRVLNDKEMQERREKLKNASANERTSTNSDQPDTSASSTTQETSFSASLSTEASRSHIERLKEKFKEQLSKYSSRESEKPLPDNVSTLTEAANTTSNSEFPEETNQNNEREL